MEVEKGKDSSRGGEGEGQEEREVYRGERGVIRKVGME